MVQIVQAVQNVEEVRSSKRSSRPSGRSRVQGSKFNESQMHGDDGLIEWRIDPILLKIS
jgi:hypothetical protein